FQAGFVIKQVHLRRSAGLEQVDDPFGLRLEMRQKRLACRIASAGLVSGEQCAQRHGAQTYTRASQEKSAVQNLGLMQLVHSHDALDGSVQFGTLSAESRQL